MYLYVCAHGNGAWSCNMMNEKKNPILVSQLANMHALLTEDCSMQMEIAFLLLLNFFVIVYHLLLK